jgi:AcrR family transcriptional regulator
MGARPRQSARRERLLDAAARLFARWGFAKTSVAEIAREAGISKGAVYLEFPDKEAVLQAVIHREIARYAEDWLQRFAQDPGEWSFARMFQHSIAAVHANPFVKALLTRDQRVLGRVLQRDTDFVAQMIAMRTELFSRLQDAGAVRADMPAPVLAYLMSAIGYGLTVGSDVIPAQHQVSFEEAMRALALLLDRGLTPPGARHRKAARAILIASVEKAQAAFRASPAGAGEQRGARQS